MILGLPKLKSLNDEANIMMGELRNGFLFRELGNGVHVLQISRTELLPIDNESFRLALDLVQIGGDKVWDKFWGMTIDDKNKVAFWY